MAMPKFKKKSAQISVSPGKSHKRFAHKRRLALAIESLLVRNQLLITRFTEVSPKEPDGGYAVIALRLGYERDMNMVRLAMAAAPVTDSNAMMQRMAWLAGHRAGKTEMGITGARALAGGHNQTSPSDIVSA